MCSKRACPLWLVIALVALLWPAFGLAQTPTEDQVMVARETFRAGEAAYARGDYQAAANAFEVSNRLASHPFTMFNAGLAWEGAKRPVRAADAFRAALDSGGLTDEQIADASARLSKLRETLGWVEIEAPEGAEISVAHIDKAKTRVIAHLTPGEHEVLVTFQNGPPERRKVTIQAAQALPLRFEPPAPDPVPGPDPTPEPEPDAGGEVSGLFIGGWVAIGLGVITGGVAIATGVTALDARDEFEASGNTDAAARDRAVTLRTTTNVLWAVAGAAAAAGVILVVVGWEDEAQTTSLRVELGPGYAGIRGSF